MRDQAGKWSLGRRDSYEHYLSILSLTALKWQALSHFILHVGLLDCGHVK